MFSKHPFADAFSSLELHFKTYKPSTAKEAAAASTWKQNEREDIESQWGQEKEEEEEGKQNSNETSQNENENSSQKKKTERK